MSLTRLEDVQNQIQKTWSPLMMKELREETLLIGAVNKDYDGEIKKKGDTVYVSQLDAPAGDNLDVDVDADSFTTESMTTRRVAVRANRRAVAAYDIEDLVDLQSDLDKDNPEVYEALKFAVMKNINDYLYSLVAPSTANPDHEIASVTDFNLAQLRAARVLAGEAKWNKLKPWYALLSPAYHGDVLDDSTLTNADYGAVDAPMINGEVALKRMGFNIWEDNSRTGDYGLLFHPDWCHLAMQTELNFQISSQHSNKRFGYVLSADIIYGAVLGIDGDQKHIRIQG